MKLKYFSSLLFSAVWALALVACGGRSGGSGGGAGASSSGSSAGTPQPIIAKYLLPEGVLAADVKIEDVGVTIEMHLENVRIYGVGGTNWAADVVYGSITLPAEDLAFEDEGKYVTVDLVSGITLERETTEDIVVRTMADGPTTTSDRRAVALQISGMQVNIPPIADANETMRTGTASAKQAQIYSLDENGRTGIYQL